MYEKVVLVLKDGYFFKMTDRMPSSFKGKAQKKTKMLMLMHSVSQNVNVILQKILTPFN